MLTINWKIIAAVSALSLLLVGCTRTINLSELESSKEIDHEAAAHSNITLGINYLQKNNIARAKQKFMRAIEYAPKLSEAWYSMAYFYETIGDIKKANDNYRYAIKLHPQNGEAHNNYGTFLCRHGKYKLAVQEFLLAIKDPKYLTVGAAFENAGLCSLRAGDQEEASHYFQQAIATDPRSKTSYYKLAKIEFQKDNLDKAYKYYVEYAKLDNKPANTFFEAMSNKKQQAENSQQNIVPRIANNTQIHKSSHTVKIAQLELPTPE